MPQPAIIKDKVIEVYEKDNGFNRSELARKLGCNTRSIRRIIENHKTGKYPVNEIEKEVSRKVTKKFTGKDGTIEVNSFTVHTLEQAMDIADVDLEKWEVDHWVSNSWSVTMKIKTKTGEGVDGDSIYEELPETKTNYQVKVWLKPKVKQPLELSIEKLIEDIPKFKFKRVPRFTAPTGILAEIALLDAHMGKLAWMKETGRRDYDLKIARKDFLNACETNLSYASVFKPEKIIFVLGQDLMHVENLQGVTSKGGNVLDSDTRYPNILDVAERTVLDCIYMCRDIAPTEVIWIPGNHDYYASLTLARVVNAHFRNDEHIAVDVSPLQRKARLWGNLLVGWTHEITSKQNAWQNELSQAFPKLWGQSVFREWHHGHKHKKSEVKTMPVLTHGGVLMRQLTALSPIDAWHYENLFTDAVPGGESFIWSKKNGVIANFTAWSDSPVACNN